MSLKQHMISALWWNLLDRVGTQGTYLLTGIVLAKLLPVDDFGLIGMLAIFIALSTILVDGGFSSALIRKQDATERDYSSIFYLNLGVSSFLYLLFFLAAPLIADFYHQPALTSLIRVLFFGLIINSAGIIQSTLYSKQINFKVQTLVNIGALAVSGGLAIGLALRGAGVWALVSQTLSLAFFKTLSLWITSSWRPGWTFSVASVKSVLHYSSHLLGAQVINTIFMNIYSLVIGKFFDVSMVGYYAQAQKMNDMALSVINNPIQSASFPILSKIQHDKERLVRAFEKTNRFASLLLFLLLPQLTLLSKPLLLFLLGTKWSDSVPFLQMLSIGSIFAIITALVNNFLRISGRTDILLKLEFFKVLITVLFLVVTIPFGALWVIAGQIGARLLICLNNMHVSGRHIDYPFKRQALDMLPYLSISLVAFGAAFPFQFWIKGAFGQLVISSTLYSLVYLGIAWKADSKILREIFDMLRKKK